MTEATYPGLFNPFCWEGLMIYNILNYMSRSHCMLVKISWQEQQEEILQRQWATATNRLQVQQKVCACLCTGRERAGLLPEIWARKLNRKWEESSAATTWCSSSRCLPEPSPREDCQDRETSVQACRQYPSPLFIERKKDSAEAVIPYCGLVYNFTYIVFIFKNKVLIFKCFKTITILTIKSDNWDDSDSTSRTRTIV